MKFGIVLAVVFAASAVGLVALAGLATLDQAQPGATHHLQHAIEAGVMIIALVAVIGPLIAAWRSRSPLDSNPSTAHDNN